MQAAKKGSAGGGAFLPGLALAATISVGALALIQGGLGRYGLSSLTLAILLGAVLGNVWPSLGAGACRSGLMVAQRHCLRAGVALYGFNLSFQQLVQVGLSGMWVDVALVLSTLAVGWLIGTRLLGLDRDTVLLTSAGSAICGAAAVVATVPVLRLKDDCAAEKSAVAVGSVVLFGSLAMGVYPLLHAWGGLAGLDFGIYVGSTVHEVAQVVAIGSSLGEAVAHHAVVAKMLRVMLLVPFLLVLGSRVAKREGKRGAAHGEENKGAAQAERPAVPLAVPWFAVMFIVLAGVNSLQILPPPLVSALRLLGGLLLTAAMAALGVETTLARMRRAGLKPLLLGAALFAHLVCGGAVINGLLWRVTQ